MRAVIACGLAALGLTACTEGVTPPVACAAYAAAGLGVTVTDADTGQPICDATVTAVEGSYSEKLVPVACTYTGAYERAGTYVVQASRDGYAPNQVGSVKVVMGGGDCPHVQQVRVTVPLSPDR